MKEELSKTTQESTKATTIGDSPKNRGDSPKHRQATSANYEYIIPEARKMIKQVLTSNLPSQCSYSA